MTIRPLFLAAAPALLAAAAAPLLLGNGPLRSTPDLGKAEGQCRPGESGPSFMVEVVGLKDHTGSLKLEVYPDNDNDFLADDNVLIMAGKTFRRVEVATPSAAVPRLCVRLPGPGTYAVTLLHDRDGNRKFNWTRDGIGFSGNPKLGWSKPKARSVAAQAGNGPTPLRIVLNYRNGLASVGPITRS
ncbi:DUF2141 domain-containing protein [Novosphingobium olei]|uniref:DUF2141 domain-containing protein n=1 Tax=Novosphingobium olei TaxID=2728851 RepID=A0A7Y0BMV3_9SPHN|nr:DUF2141 domain-containing protein [Novosphingobium olei]NML93239.1 DUF2141 domain-containing protein [Novosphingobium olei]BEU99800.1 DUF2141 domain-containing protein [Novosphingobium olei]